MELQEETDKSTIMVADFTILLSIIDGSMRENQQENFTTTPNPLDLIDTYRTCHSSIAKYTFFSRAYNTFAKRDPTLGYKTRLSILKRIQVIHSVFSDHKGIKIDINNRMISG